MMNLAMGSGLSFEGRSVARDGGRMVVLARRDGGGWNAADDAGCGDAGGACGKRSGAGLERVRQHGRALRGEFPGAAGGERWPFHAAFGRDAAGTPVHRGGWAAALFGDGGEL